MLTAGKSKPARYLKLCIAFVISIALLCMLQLVIAYETSQSASAAETNKNIFVDNDGSDSDVVYLSDIPYANAKVGWGSLTLDKNGVNNGGITLNVNGSATTFNKGIFAHATSTVDYDISQYSSEYSHFVTYYGLNTTNNNVGNGVKVLRLHIQRRRELGPQDRREPDAYQKRQRGRPVQGRHPRRQVHPASMPTPTAATPPTMPNGPTPSWCTRATRTTSSGRSKTSMRKSCPSTRAVPCPRNCS